MHRRPPTWTLREGSWLLFAIWGALLAPSLLAVDPAAGADETELPERVFLPPDRAMRQLLDRAEQLLVQRRYSEAVQALSSVLNAPEDFFFRPDDVQHRPVPGQTYRSLKSEARRLIGELPEEGRKSYELQFGPVARRQLDQALAQRDMEAVADVTRRYFHTEAGYDAMVLLGRYYVDQGRPLAAALCFEQVRRTAAAASYEPSLSLLLSVCWQRSGESDKAAASLADLTRRWPQGRLEIAGRETDLFGGPRPDEKWLSMLAGPQPVVTRGTTDWTMFGGDPSRTARTTGDRPLLLRPCWRQRTVLERSVEELIAARSQQMFDQSQPAFPALQPLAVGNQVLMRTSNRLSAVDLETGKLIWQVEPQDEAEAPDSGYDSENDNRVATAERAALANDVYECVWHDSTHGTMSSDGELVFVVEENHQRVVLDSLGRRRSQWGNDAERNVLAAYEIKRSQGKRRWSVGGPTGGEPKLEQAFFLGPPLPLQGRLYAIVEVSGEIRLVVLSAETGKLQWSQQLAVVDDEVARDTTRHRCGISPSFADGVLICPTTVGAVVAIDLTTRSLLWGYQYPRDAATVINREGFGPWVQRAMGDTAASGVNGWIDSTAMISRGRVILTPAESTQMHCLNLTNGRLEWKLDRGENLYVACIHGDRVIAVGRGALSAISLAGAQVKTLPLGDGNLPSGRGVYTDRGYFLPLVTPTGGEIDHVDLDRLQIVERIHSRDGSVPGNLICYQGQVLSQGPDSLQCYYQLGSLNERIKAILAKDADNPWALARRGEILLDQQQYTEAVLLLRRAYDKDTKLLALPDAAANRGTKRTALAERLSTRALLVDALLESLKADFAGRRQTSAEIAGLIELPEERLRYLRILAEGLERSGEMARAAQSYLDLLDAAGEHDDLFTAEPAHAVRLDSWLAARLSAIRPRLSDEARKKFDDQVVERLRSAEKSADLAALRKHLVLFAGQPTAATARLRLATRLAGTENVLERVRLLEPLVEAGDPATKREAVARLAVLLTEAGQMDEAALYFRRLLKEWPDQVCLDGKTGRQLFEALPPGSPARIAARSAANWPYGAVKLSQESVLTRYPGGYQPAFELTTAGRQATDPERVFVDPQQGTIIGFDALGRPCWRVPISHDDDSENRMLNRELSSGRFDGHLVVLSIGNQVLGVNTLRANSGSRTNGVLWTDESAQHATTLYEHAAMHGGPARPWEDDDPEQRNYRQNAIRLGPITAGGVTYMRNRELVSVDPLTGTRLWSRRDIPAESELFGDEDLLLAIPPDSTEALVLRTTDGALLGRREVPPQLERWTTVGRKILALRSGNAAHGGQQLVLVDPWTKTDLWAYSLQRRTKMALVSATTAALLDREGRFALLDLITGKSICRQRLEPEPRLSALYVQSSRNCLLLIANQHTNRGTQNEVIEAAHENGGPLITGRIYALDPTTGRPLWPVPATIEKFGLVLEQPTELPVAVFARRVLDRSGNQQRTAFLFLDKRTGALAVPTREYPNRINNFDILGDGEKKTMTLFLRSTSGMLTLHFTDQPTPPEPPIQIEAHRYAESRRFGDTLSGVMKAISKAAEQLQGLPVDDEEQEKDLFGK